LEEVNVSKVRAVLFAMMFVAAGAFAMDDMKMDMKMMDTNSDGMISKEEFMKFHEDMWAKMKKNKSGMVDMKDMQTMMSGDMMKHGSMMKEGSMTKDKASK
jgi:sulfatase maturation enzyme AslB (radical SAM superfamily)